MYPSDSCSYTLAVLCSFLCHNPFLTFSTKHIHSWVMLLALTPGLPPCARAFLCVPYTTSNGFLIACQAACSDSVPKSHPVIYFLTVSTTDFLRFGFPKVWGTLYLLGISTCERERKEVGLEAEIIMLCRSNRSLANLARGSEATTTHLSCHKSEWNCHPLYFSFTQSPGVNTLGMGITLGKATLCC